LALPLGRARNDRVSRKDAKNGGTAGFWFLVSRFSFCAANVSRLLNQLAPFSAGAAGLDFETSAGGRTAVPGSDKSPHRKMIH
jgi:hypothetical protein